jgi:type I restriction enzyme S subunit
MGSEFRFERLGNHADVFSGFAFKSSDWRLSGIPVVKIKNVNNGVVDISDTQFFSPEPITGRHDKFFVTHGDVLIAMTGQGSVGRVGRLHLREDEKILLNQRVGKFEVKSTLDLRYLYYILSSSYYEDILFSAATGSGQPNLSPSTISNIEIPIISLEEQKRFAGILGALDDKIELNRQTNQTLEKMTQALFKSWFVDFDPVIDNALEAGNTIPDELQDRAERRQQQLAKPDHQPLFDDIRQLFPSAFDLTEELGWVPLGWKSGTLSEITTELRRGISPKYVEDGGVAVLNQKCVRNHEINHTLGRRNNPELRKIDGRELLLGDVLINSTGVGTLGRIAQVTYLPETTVVDSHVTVVRPDQSIYPSFAFGQMMLSIENHIESLGEGSTGQTELSRKIVSEQKIMIPDLEILNVANQQLKNLSEKAVINSKEIQTLTKLRDTLLPKLISGELRLPSDALSDTEQQLADTTS